VTQRQIGEVLVLKELLHYDEEANSSFLKEVSSIQRALYKLKYTAWQCGFLFFIATLQSQFSFSTHIFIMHPFLFCGLASINMFALLRSVYGVIFLWIISLAE